MNRKSSYLNIEFLSACTEAKLYPEDFGNEVAICGRSNSGKSSIINALANSKKLAKTSNTQVELNPLISSASIVTLTINSLTCQVTVMPKHQKKCKKIGVDRLRIT